MKKLKEFEIENF